MGEKTAMEARGDAIKRVESLEAGRRALPGLPLIARLDGRAFHTFTRHLDRPFDLGMVNAMHGTTRDLVGEFKPLVGYTLAACTWDAARNPPSALGDGA